MKIGGLNEKSGVSDVKLKPGPLIKLGVPHDKLGVSDDKLGLESLIKNWGLQ